MMTEMQTASSQTKPQSSKFDVAILLPCYNEGTTIETVIRQFRAALPNAKIYVYDNNSSDNSAEIAAKADAIVRCESRQGKGYVVRRMLADIEADIFIMCDSDNTYDASAAPHLVQLLIDDGLDMVVGVRAEDSDAAYRRAHKFGNWLLTSMVKVMFGHGFDDMLSGYRVMSNRFVKSFPQMSQGFEIETELTIHALQLEMPATESPTAYRERPEGSTSKLRTIPDGIQILTTILVMLKQERPLYLFTVAFFLLFATSILIGSPVVSDFIETGPFRACPRRFWPRD